MHGVNQRQEATKHESSNSRAKPTTSVWCDGGLPLPSSSDHSGHLTTYISELNRRSLDAVKVMQQSRLSFFQYPSLQREQDLLRSVRDGESIERRITLLLGYLSEEQQVSARGGEKALLLQRQTEVHTAILTCTQIHADKKNRRSREGSTSTSTLVGGTAVSSLLRTRAALSIEVKKVDGALQELKGDKESMEELHQALTNVSGALDTAMSFTKKLMSIQKADDFFLRASFMAFLLTVAYIILQRVFGFFPVVILV